MQHFRRVDTRVRRAQALPNRNKQIEIDSIANGVQLLCKEIQYGVASMCICNRHQNSLQWHRHACVAADGELNGKVASCDS